MSAGIGEGIPSESSVYSTGINSIIPSKLSSSKFKRSTYPMTSLQEIEQKISYNHHIISSHEGIYQQYGKDAGVEKNHYWIARNKHTGDEYGVIHCEHNYLTKVDTDMLDEIHSLQKSIYYSQCGYVNFSLDSMGSKTLYYLHSYVVDHFGNGKGQASVDHINRQKLDNRSMNLRVCTQSDQNRNMKCIVQKAKDCVMPNGMTYNSLPKFVRYVTNTLPSGTVQQYFVIESHPRQKLTKAGKRRKYTTKSVKVSCDLKYNEAMKILRDLDNGFESREYDFFDANKFYQEEFEQPFTYDEYMKNVHLMTFDPHYDDPTPEAIELYNKYVTREFPEKNIHMYGPGADLSINIGSYKAGTKASVGADECTTFLGDLRSPEGIRESSTLLARQSRAQSIRESSYPDGGSKCDGDDDGEPTGTGDEPTGHDDEHISYSFEDVKKMVEFNHTIEEIFVEMLHGFVEYSTKLSNLDPVDYVWVVKHNYTDDTYALRYYYGYMVKMDIYNIEYVASLEECDWTYNKKSKYMEVSDSTNHTNMQRWIMDKGNEKKSTACVYHMNQQTLDNREENLKRVGTTDSDKMRYIKMSRPEAREIRPGWTTHDLPKYIHYVRDTLPNGSLQECFRISRHPRQVSGGFGVKPWTGSKGAGVSIEDKYKAALEKLKEFDNGFESIEYDFFDANKFYMEEFQRTFTLEEFTRGYHLMNFNPHYDEPTEDDIAAYKAFVEKK